MSIVIDADLRVGEPQRCGAMTLFPLLHPRGPEPRSYVSGPEAADSLEVRERSGGIVAELLAHNPGDRPLLLIEGEALLGAKQDRVLNVSVLLAAHGSATLPVSCIEAGRWGRAQPSTRSARHVPPRLRARKTRSVVASARRSRSRHSDQGAVWDEIEAYEHAVGALSATSALREVQEVAARRIEPLLPDEGPRPDQVGVIVATGGRPNVLELFDDPATFDAYWQGLVDGYALDAALSGHEDATTSDQAEAFLDATRHAPFESRPGVSLGDEVHAETDELVATGLGWGGELLHLVCFAA